MFLTAERLLDLKTQESFYNKIVARYMQFCTQHGRDLDNAFASLSLEEVHPSTTVPARNQAARGTEPQPIHAPSPHQQDFTVPAYGQATAGPTTAPSAELSTILIALRKLREGLLASSASAQTPVFSQRVHVFNVRAAILALHPEGYHPSLLHLLTALHTPDHPLPRSELVEMITYLVLDTAIRQNDLMSAYALRYKYQVRVGFKSRVVDSILKSIVMGDWVNFWRVRQKVDGYIRAILHWYLESQRRMALKAIGRAYYSCDVKWILQSSTGGEMSWDELVRAEDVGWMRDGERVMIRKPKAKAG
jgi:hypothetical protein